MEAGWAHANDESARQSLRVTLTSLRQTFGPHCFNTDRDTVRLNSEFFSIDVVEFRLDHNPKAYGGRLLEGRIMNGCTS